jgi:hypothetical protein
MFFRISDKATDILHKSIVRGMSIHPNYIVKTFILDLSETEEGYMLARISSLAVAEERFLSGRSCRVILSVVLPIEQISDRPMLAIVVERPLVV